MATCSICSKEINTNGTRRVYCSKACARRACKSGQGGASPKLTSPIRQIKCPNCQFSFETQIGSKKFCCRTCAKRFFKICSKTQQMMERAANGAIITSSQTYTPSWTRKEINALRADPLCVLPNRTLRAQWDKCHQLSIPRDRSLFAEQGRTPEAVARRKAALRGPLAYRQRDRHRRGSFRRRIRADPAPVLAELRQLARGHQHAEDLALEGFAIVLRLAIPPAEAIKLARSEVNRTSAQPFREQSFNPDIDYATRETGRQVPRASDIRAADESG